MQNKEAQNVPVQKAFWKKKKNNLLIHGELKRVEQEHCTPSP